MNVKEIRWKIVGNSWNFRVQKKKEKNIRVNIVNNIIILPKFKVCRFFFHFESRIDHSRLQNRIITDVFLFLVYTTIFSSTAFYNYWSEFIHVFSENKWIIVCKYTSKGVWRIFQYVCIFKTQFVSCAILNILEKITRFAYDADLYFLYNKHYNV